MDTRSAQWGLIALVGLWFAAGAATGAPNGKVVDGSGRASARTERAERGVARHAQRIPRWLDSGQSNAVSYKRGRYNFDVYRLPKLARDLNAVAVGHAMAYEDLVTGKARTLETATFGRIRWVLEHPPSLMPDEASVSPTFGREFGVLEQVFDRTHTLHAQTIDVLASRKLSEDQKDREIEKLWEFYLKGAPFTVTHLPMNMAHLDSQSYSGKFRKRYPKVNGLFWGYHWLQGTVYDTLYRVPADQQLRSYDVVGDEYHRKELYRTDRPFMPMFAETSPRFAGRFPQLANAFDNLHMLHDMVNDILASDEMSHQRKREEVKRAIWLVSTAAHSGEQPGGEPSAGPHDHRHFNGMPGMGMMKRMTPELMWMPGQGWMSMADCHHCSMPLWEGRDAWRNPTVSAEGWTMRVRCALCARDMSAESKGRVILRIPTEDPHRMLVAISDDQGNLTPSLPEAVFLEQESSHAGCESWSRAFTSRRQLDAYMRVHPEYKDEQALTFDQWAQRQGDKPDTYVKPRGPVENPYAEEPLVRR
jgi:hypothetical protein